MRTKCSNSYSNHLDGMGQYGIDGGCSYDFKQMHYFVVTQAGAV